MKTINSSQLAFLLKTTVAEMDEKIFVMKQRIGGNDDNTISRTGLEKGQSCSLKEFERYYNLNISLAIESIKKNYLKNTATRSWIMDYPDKKLVPDKKGLLPKTIKIPTALKSFLTDEQKEEIINKWNEIYKSHLPVYEEVEGESILKKEGTVFI